MPRRSVAPPTLAALPRDEAIWRNDMLYADITLDLRDGDDTDLPAVLPTTPGTVRRATVDGWEVSQHRVRTTADGKTLVVMRLRAPTGWAAAFAMTLTNTRRSWLREWTPAFGRILYPGTAGPDRLRELQRSFRISARTFYRTINQPEGFGVSRDFNGALKIVEWATCGIPDESTYARLRDDSRFWFAPSMVCDIHEAGWDLDEASLPWLTEAIAGRWIEKHAGRWGLRDLKELRDQGWSLDTIRRFHTGDGYWSITEWRRQCAIDGWAALVGPQKASAYIDAGFTLDEAAAYEATREVAIEEIQALLALREANPFDRLAG